MGTAIVTVTTRITIYDTLSFCEVSAISTLNIGNKMT